MAILFLPPEGSSEAAPDRRVFHFDDRSLAATFTRPSTAVKSTEGGTFSLSRQDELRRMPSGLLLEGTARNKCTPTNVDPRTVETGFSILGVNGANPVFSIVEDEAALREAGFGRLLDAGAMGANVYCIDNTQSSSGGAVVTIEGACEATVNHGLSIVWRAPQGGEASIYLSGGYRPAAPMPTGFARECVEQTPRNVNSRLVLFAAPNAKIHFCLFQLEEGRVTSPLPGAGAVRAADSLVLHTGDGGVLTLTFDDGTVQVLGEIRGDSPLPVPLDRPILREVSISEGSITFLRGIAADSIRGMKVDPGYMVAARYANLGSAGINTLRLQPEIADYIALSESGRADMLAEWRSNIAQALAQGFRVHFQGGIRKSQRLPTQAIEVDWQAYCDALVAFSEMIGAHFAPREVMIDLFNEPEQDNKVADAGGAFGWVARAQDVWRRIRAALPAHTLGVQGVNPRSVKTVTDFDPATFDGNTLFVIHCYDMGVWTHQGRDYPHMYGIPFPAAAYPGGYDAAVVDMTARVEADATLGETQKAAMIADHTNRLNYIFANGPGKSGFSDLWLGDDLVDLDAWIARTGLPARQVYIGEFGCVSEQNWPLKGQLDFDASEAQAFLESARAPFLDAIMQISTRRGFAGWLLHQLHGDFHLGQQSSISDYGEDLLPEVRALLEAAPVAQNV